MPKWSTSKGRTTKAWWVEIPIWKWEMINMYFVVGLPCTPRKFDSIWVIVDRLTKSSHFLPGAQFTANCLKKFQKGFGTKRYRSPIGWFEIGKVELIGPDLVNQAMKKVMIIAEWLKTALSRQKSYSDIRRSDLEFKEDYWVFLKVSPMKSVMQFGKKGELCPRYLEPYIIIQRIGRVAYKLERPPEMCSVHPVFHVSMLKKVIGDPSLIVPIETASDMGGKA
uniref:Tf2-1-like SH3-like domain-containing protein n=1 Tax=Nicotiana tabacum TaxID=4097 RepID=A0A1S4B6M3_TOBAC|nr:PREDICTED: uncharacterized protein LOC107805124 [Nicotiana tabacum]